MWPSQGSRPPGRGSEAQQPGSFTWGRSRPKVTGMMCVAYQGAEGGDAEWGPMMWIHQAFSVTGSVSVSPRPINTDVSLPDRVLANADGLQIILCLDMFHRPRTDRQTSEHWQHAEDDIEILSHCETDMIARRDVSLLRTMLDAEQKGCSDRTLREPPLLTETTSKESSFDLAVIIQTFYRTRLGKHHQTLFNSSWGFFPW